MQQPADVGLFGLMDLGYSNLHHHPRPLQLSHESREASIERTFSFFCKIEENIIKGYTTVFSFYYKVHWIGQMQVS